MQDEYGKEAIVEILIRRDMMSEEEARELIAEFQEELLGMTSSHSLSAIEEIFSDYFGLEPDYLFCFLNDALAKESK
jgi:hypothetical protein